MLRMNLLILNKLLEVTRNVINNDVVNCVTEDISKYVPRDITELITQTKLLKMKKKMLLATLIKMLH